MNKAYIEQAVADLHAKVFEQKHIFFPMAGPPSPIDMLVDRQAHKIAVSQRFGRESMRSSGAHEIGHFILHTDRVMHRDPPMRDMPVDWSDPMEREANHFAVCYLVPERLLLRAIASRFKQDERGRIILNDVNAASFGEPDDEMSGNSTGPSAPT